jgi:adenylate cyclase
VRKSNWVSLVLALLIAALFSFLEQRRSHYFLEAHPSSSSKWDFMAAFYMQRAEWALYDARFKMRGIRAPHPDVAIIAIDERSLQDVGQWPWSRGIHAKLIRTLAAAAPKALLFDVFFIEPFTNDPAGDRALAAATRDNPWVVHAFFFDIDRNDVVAGIQKPMAPLLRVLDAVGYANAVIDEDGTLRRARTELSIDQQSLPLLSVAGANLYLGKPWQYVDPLIPHDARGRMLVNFVGPAESFPTFSYIDVLNGKIPADRFANKVVLVGSKATGTFDHYPTATSEFMPGVEFHANVIDNLLSHRELRMEGLRATYAAIVVFALFCGFLLAQSSAGAGALWALGAGLLYAGLAQWLFSARCIVIDMAGPLLTLTMAYVAIVIYRFFTEEREKRWVKAAFGQYVSPKVLDILMDDPSKLKMVGDRRDMTVFFSDVAGFTSISERMNPDEMVVLLNRYLSAMTEVIFEYDGYLNKYMGDGIMAFWNAPIRQADHAECACRCALKSRQRLKEFNEELRSQGLIPLGARIGVNSGTMVVGNMGSQQKSDYTVMGDNVNLGSRLEGANKAFGSSIMISEFTYELVQDKFDVRFLDRIRVPGKAKPVRVYELLAEKGQMVAAWQKALPLYHAAIQLFSDRQFTQAREKFLEVLPILGQDKACTAYIQRAEAFLSEPPADSWDGVFEVKSK